MAKEVKCASGVRLIVWVNLLAAAISWDRWHSAALAVGDGALGWLYVGYVFVCSWFHWRGW